MHGSLSFLRRWTCTTYRSFDWRWRVSSLANFKSITIWNCFNERDSFNLSIFE